MEKIIDHARTNFAPTVANLIAFRFFSGLRTSEMVTLRWQSIDCNKMQVLIPQGGLRKQAKTNKARLVSLNSRALDALERQKEQTPEGATRQRGRGRHAPNHTQGLTDGLCGTDAWRALG
ncbi:MULTISPECIES: tyrosine-type recombinase/integrase [Comamonas]|uniref:tyrosine-type recombinase/integrase n=1 Tax=Comamonas TaxID=283 RepID=UPI000AB35AB0|nr:MULTISPECIES: tyrosine-type recombinase/integrase [Comamonas]